MIFAIFNKAGSFNYLTGRTDYPKINRGANFGDNEHNIGGKENNLSIDEHKQLMNIAEGEKE